MGAYGPLACLSGSVPILNLTANGRRSAGTYEARRPAWWVCTLRKLGNCVKQPGPTPGLAPTHRLLFTPSPAGHVNESTLVLTLGKAHRSETTKAFGFSNLGEPKVCEAEPMSLGPCRHDRARTPGLLEEHCRG